MKLDLPPFLTNINPLVAGGALLAAAALLMFPRSASASLLRRGKVGKREIELSRRAGVPIAVLRALAQKESTEAPPPIGGWPRGKGVGKAHQWGGPKVMRFEPHVFNRKVSSSKQMPSSGGTSASYVKSETRWNAFREAMRRDPRAAIESSSWGRFQVMGSNFLKKLYGNDANRFVNAWLDADWNDAEDMSDAYLTEWFVKRPKTQKWANMPMGKIVRYGKKDRRVVDVLARQYNGSYSYANDETRDDGSIKPGLMSTYRNQVAKGAPTTMV